MAEDAGLRLRRRGADGLLRLSQGRSCGEWFSVIEPPRDIDQPLVGGFLPCFPVLFTSATYFNHGNAMMTPKDRWFRDASTTKWASLFHSHIHGCSCTDHDLVSSLRFDLLLTSDTDIGCVIWKYHATASPLAIEVTRMEW